MKSFLIDMLGLCHVVAIHVKIRRKYIVKEVLTYINQKLSGEKKRPKLVKIIRSYNNSGTSISLSCFIDVIRLARLVRLSGYYVNQPMPCLSSLSHCLVSFNSVLNIFRVEWFLGVIYM